jgi:hypothetical protein
MKSEAGEAGHCCAIMPLSEVVTAAVGQGRFIFKCNFGRDNRRELT